ncbi:hypothetical protein WJX84_001637 [Apatococcus fuscideae]|uniref:SprT-like domain-containing protein n=1 Tax=Apatococcus fuscideae TaxID=2026836 RepID=A0AAW1T6L0_9CHLO
MSENLSQYSGSSARLASLLAEFGIQSPHGQKPSTSPSLDSIESSPSFFSAKSRSEESAGSYDGAECVIPVASPLAECLVPRRAHFALHSSPESLSEAVQDSIRSVARGRSSWAPSDSSPEVLNDAATSRHDTGPGTRGDQENQVPRTPFTPVARPPQTPAMASRQMPAPASRSVAKQLAAFRKERAALARDLYCRWNREVFASQLPSDLDITWNNNLRTTAGLMHYKRQGLQHLAEVDLSSKVLDCRAKLEATLAHEMCHAGAWVIDHVSKPPHGAAFQRWVGRFRDVRPDLDITTCHSYEVHYAFRWQCTNAACRRIFKRHSNSIDVSKQVCGACKSKLQSLGRFQADGTPARSRAPTPFSMSLRYRPHLRAQAPENYEESPVQASAST